MQTESHRIEFKRQLTDSLEKEAVAFLNYRDGGVIYIGVDDTLRKEKLTKAEEQKVKLAAKHLITRLLDEHPKVLVQDWWKDGQTQRKVKSAVEQVLDADLPDTYDRVLFKGKSDNVFNLIVDFAVQGKKWAA